MNPIRALTAAAIAALLAGCGSAASAGSARPDSGIRGNVVLGPTCAAQRAGQTCLRPYRATIAVRNERGGRLIARIRSSRNGRFVLALAPGRYLLVPRVGAAYPRATPLTITVLGHRYTRVTISYDSGIR